MIAILLGTLAEIIMFFGFTALVYQVFLSDAVKDWRIRRRKRIEASNSAEKIAQIKLLSDDFKEIESFVEKNAQFLSEKIVKQLVARLEYLKADKIIKEDDLKKRVQVILPVIEKLAEEAQEVEDQRIKVRRR